MLERGQDRLEGLLRRRPRDHGDAVLVIGQGLEGGELGRQQARGHEVPLTVGHALLEFLGLGEQVDEEDPAPRAGEQVAVGALERGAGDDSPDTVGGAITHPVAHGLQPGPAVLVGQGDAAAHLVDIGLGMEVVGLGDGPAQCVVKVECGRGLAAAGDPHEDEVLDGSAHVCSLMTPLS